MFGLGDKMKILSKKYSDTKYEFFCKMADYLQVSRTALSYRMEQLDLLENNRLIIEAVPPVTLYLSGLYSLRLDPNEISIFRFPRLVVTTLLIRVYPNGVEFQRLTRLRERIIIITGRRDIRDHRFPRTLQQ